MKTRRLLPIACVLATLLTALGGEPAGRMERLPPAALPAAQPAPPEGNSSPVLQNSSALPRKVVKVAWT